MRKHELFENVKNSIGFMGRFLGSIFGNVTSPSTDGKHANIQILDEYESSDVRVVLPYGLSSSLPDDTTVHCTIDSDGKITAVTGAYDDGRPDTKPGESMIYDKFGHRVHLDEAGIHITGNVDINGDPIGGTSDIEQAIEDIENRVDDIDEAIDLLAPKNNPSFTGNPTVPTPNITNISGSISTTQFIKDYTDCLLLYGVTDLSGAYVYTYESHPEYGYDTKAIVYEFTYKYNGILRTAHEVQIDCLNYGMYAYVYGAIDGNGDYYVSVNYGYSPSDYFWFIFIDGPDSSTLFIPYYDNSPQGECTPKSSVTFQQVSEHVVSEHAPYQDTVNHIYSTHATVYPIATITPTSNRTEVEFTGLSGGNREYILDFHIPVTGQRFNMYCDVGSNSGYAANETYLKTLHRYGKTSSGGSMINEFKQDIYNEFIGYWDLPGDNTFIDGAVTGTIIFRNKNGIVQARGECTIYNTDKSAVLVYNYNTINKVALSGSPNFTKFKLRFTNGTVAGVGSKFRLRAGEVM